MSTDTAPPPDLRPTDFLAIDGLLSEEERDIRDLVRAFVRDRVAARRRGLVRGGAHPARARDGAGPDRRAGHAPRRLRLRGRERDGLRARLPGARGGRQRRAEPRLRPGLARHVRHPPLGLGGAEAGVAPAHGRRRGDRLLRPDGAGLGLRSGLHAHARPARRRRLDPARPEDVGHERLDRRRRHRVGADGRRHPRLRRAHGQQGLQHAGHPPQALAARVRQLRAAAGRRPPARERAPARGHRA